MKMAKVVFMCSRNKDNKDVMGFHERKETFFYHSDSQKNFRRFDAFVRAGVTGEFCRMYVSVNARDLDKAKKNLMCEMVQNDDFDLTKVETRAVSHAMKPECAAEHHWLFDFDCTDKTALFHFLAEVGDYSPEVFKTPHGYAVVVEHGFDTRELMERWKDVVTLKRDDMLCLRWATKEED